MVNGAVGGVPFGMIGIMPHIERGWIKKCQKKTEWHKVPANKVDTKECGFTPLNVPGK